MPQEELTEYMSLKPTGRYARRLWFLYEFLMKKFAPEGVIFSTSAAMLNDRAAYDASLEAFSIPLSPLVDYTLDENGAMTVHNETAIWYRYIDTTAQAEALCRFIARTVEVELPEEFAFLVSYGQAKRGIQEIVDLPGRLIDLFIRFCRQNNGKLSSRERDDFFDKLTDEEIVRMEQVVKQSNRP